MIQPPDDITLSQDWATPKTRARGAPHAITTGGDMPGAALALAPRPSQVTAATLLFSRRPRRSRRYSEKTLARSNAFCWTCSTLDAFRLGLPRRSNAKLNAPPSDKRLQKGD